MNKKFIERLTEYLDSECDDFGLEYDYTWNEDTKNMEVTITRNNIEKCVNFRFENNSLQIELSEDSFYETCEYEVSVKYFWMLICPKLFKD